MYVAHKFQLSFISHCLKKEINKFVFKPKFAISVKQLLTKNDEVRVGTRQPLKTVKAIYLFLSCFFFFVCDVIIDA